MRERSAEKFMLFFKLESCTGTTFETRPYPWKFWTRPTRPVKILNPPDPTRVNVKPARPDPWRFQTRPTRPDILKTSSIAIYRFVLGPVRRVAIALISHEIQKASFFVLNSIKKCPPLSSDRILFQRKRISPFSRALLMVSLEIPLISEYK